VVKCREIDREQWDGYYWVEKENDSVWGKGKHAVYDCIDDDGDRHGVVTVKWFQRESDPTTCYLDYVETAPSWVRGRGYATDALANEMFQWWKAGCRTITGHSLHTARPFWEKRIGASVGGEEQWLPYGDVTFDLREMRTV